MKNVEKITDSVQLAHYLENVDYLSDNYITFFSYDSTAQQLEIIIEERDMDQQTISPKVWRLQCESVDHLSIQNTESTSTQKIGELFVHQNRFFLRLISGFISFEAASFTFDVPKYEDISHINMAYVMQSLESSTYMKNMTFSFDSDSMARVIGYAEDNQKPYWATVPGHSRPANFETIDDLFDAKIYNNQSLKERWSEVKIERIDGLTLTNWLSRKIDTADMHVFIKDMDHIVINGVELPGFVDVEYSCDTCGSSAWCVEQYTSYFCPYCNRWLDVDDEGIAFFKRKRPLEPALMWQPNKKLNFCQVQFHPGGKNYTYHCVDNAISVGDWVIVPVGSDQVEKEVRVVKVFQCPVTHPPFPLNHIKSVIQKKSHRNRQADQTMKLLLSNGKVCDIVDEQQLSYETGAYDIVKTPIGNFWLEFNGEPIKMKLSTRYPPADEKYFVEGVYRIKPVQVDFENFIHLKLMTNVDIPNARWIDNLSSAYQDGNNWQVDAYDIGIAVHPQEYDDYEVLFTDENIPYYAIWPDEYKTCYAFTVAWKYYVSDDDLSMWNQVSVYAN